MLDNGEIMDKVRDLVEKSGLEPSEIARRCGEPEKKIRQILDGAKNPSFTPLCGIITACGGSVEEIIGAAQPAVQTSPSNEGLVIQLRNDLRHERRRAAQGWVLFICAVAFIIIVLVFDLLSPQFGWFRYEAQRRTMYVGENTAHVAICRAIGATREFIL